MADKQTVAQLEAKALEARKNLLILCNKAGALHLGGDFSMVEIMTALWQHKIKYDPENPKWEERDRFFLSKGHGAGGLYIAQMMIGCYTLDDIYANYGRFGSRFGMHPCSNTLPFIEISTGSLGHGLSIAAGVASGLRRKGNRTSHVYVLLGDGELQEGSNWEAAMAIPTYKLGNVVAFIDRNGLSLDDDTENIVKLEPLGDRWRTFGWNVVEIDGNDMGQVVDVLDALPDADAEVPTVVIGRTTKGYGLDFMENVPAWHAGSVDDELLQECLDKLDQRFMKKEG